MPVSETNTLTHWSIRRSGGALVITGRDPQGQTRKFTGVAAVYGASNRDFGVKPLPSFSKDGVTWSLA